MELIIAANWKMHKTAAEAAAFCRDLRQKEEEFSGVEAVICPPFTAIAVVAEVLRGSLVKIGAQNMHFAKQGAYTGEIAPSMLLEHGVEYVIIGHSERRQLLGEDSSLIRQKVSAALESGLKPILCLGETEEQREQGMTEKVIEVQLKGALEGLSPGQTEGLVIAYEPVWAIGSGKAASGDDAENAGKLIYRYLKERSGEKVADSLRVQYGGSVKEENIDAFVSLPSVHGALVGGASLESSSFLALLKAARKAVQH